MKSKMRYISLVLIGAILLSLMAIVPAFSATGDVDFVMPDDPDESLDYTKQGGDFMIEVDDDDLNVPVKHVLIAADLTSALGDYEVKAGTKDIVAMSASTTIPTSIVAGDTIILSGLGQTVREVVSVNDPVAADGTTPAVNVSITVNEPFAADAEDQVVSEVDDDDATYEDCPTCAMSQPKTLNAGATQFVLGSIPVVDSGVGSGRPTNGTTRTAANRITGGEDTLLTADDVLILAADGSVIDALTVVGAAGLVSLESAPGAATEVTVSYWGSVRNDTGSAVRVSSTADSTGITVVLEETGPTTGIFRATVNTTKDEETESDAAATLLKVGASDTIRVAYSDADPTRTARDSLAVESTNPTFSNLSPAHGISGKEPRRDAAADVTDANSGVDEESIQIVFARATAGSTVIDAFEVLSPEDTGRVRDLPTGFRVVQGPTSGLVGTEDSNVYWWVIAKDMAGNVAVTDRQESKDFYAGRDDDDGNPIPVEITSPLGQVMMDPETITVDDTCNAEQFVLNDLMNDDVGLSAAISGCQPYSYSVDFTAPELDRAITGSFWDTDSEDEDKTETDTADADPTSIRVDFNEEIDGASVSRDDFRVIFVDEDGDETVTTPQDAEVFSGNSDSVFLTVRRLDPDAAPTIEIVGEVMDTAGNSLESDETDAVDGIGPSLEVTIAGTAAGDGRPVSDEEIVVTISVNEPVASPKVTVYEVNKLSVADDPDTDADESEEVLKGSPRGTERAAALQTDGSYSYTFKSSSPGLYSVYVEARDSGNNNTGKAGDMTTPISLDDDTSALLFEIDTAVAAPAITPESTDNDDPFITFDFTAEGAEKTATTDEADVEIDVDSHGTVSIIGATFDGEDITADLVTTDNIKFLYRASNLAPAEYDVTIEAVDEAGNSKEFEGTVEVTERAAFKVSLAPGWNLVSIPAEAADSDINSVIGADHPATEVRSYDPSIPGGWLFAVRSNGAFTGTLTNITSGRAYWVLTDSFESIEVDIPRLSAGSPVAPPTVNIVKGWNMVPVQDVTESRESVSAELYFSGIEDVSRVYTFNTVANAWESVTVGSEDENGVPTDMLEIGRGYWVFATSEGTLAP